MIVTGIGMAMTVRTVAFMSSTFSGVDMIDRFGSKTSALVGSLIEASPLLLYPLITNPTLVLMGGCGSEFFLTSQALLTSLQIGEKCIGSGVGIYRTFQDSGSVLGPILIMLIAEMINSRAPFIFGLIAYLSRYQ